MDTFLSEFNVYLIELLYQINSLNYYYVIIFLFVFSIIFFSLPIPGAFLVTINASFLGFFGFLVSYISCNISALLAFFLLKKILKKKNIFKKKFLYIDKNKNNLYMLTFLRLIIPFFAFTYFASFLKINTKKFFIATMLGSFPATFAITLFISRLKKNILNNESLDIVLFKDPYFIISILIIFIIIFFTNFFKKKFNLNN